MAETLNTPALPESTMSRRQVLATTASGLAAAVAAVGIVGTSNTVAATAPPAADTPCLTFEEELEQVVSGMEHLNYRVLAVVVRGEPTGCFIRIAEVRAGSNDPVDLDLNRRIQKLWARDERAFLAHLAATGRTMQGVGAPKTMDDAAATVAREQANG